MLASGITIPAILTTEYEFQFTSLERAKALSAKTPTELEDSLKRVRDLVRRGAPTGGGNPTQLIAVLSLKKNLLQPARLRARVHRGDHHGHHVGPAAAGLSFTGFEYAFVARLSPTRWVRRLGPAAPGAKVLGVKVDTNTLVFAWDSPTGVVWAVIAEADGAPR